MRPPAAGAAAARRGEGAAIAHAGRGSTASPIRVPTGVLPAPAVAALPPPVPLRAMVGPSVILAGLSIGSGELVLWPRLVAEHGFAVFWAAWIGVTLQFFLNLEITRYSLATGESAVTGFVRLSRVFGPAFFLCGTIPWIWPGWATGAATFVSWQTGLPVTPLAVAGLVLCGLVLSIGPVVYRTMEALQLALVSVIFVLLGALAWLVVGADDVAALAAGAARVGHVPEGIDLPLFLGALAFAGAGGTVNLAQSNYVKDKGYGMGRFAGRITSPFTGREEAVSEIGTVFAGSGEDLARWRVWWRRANAEHFLSFWLLCVGSLALLCLIAHALLTPGAPVSGDLGFIGDQASALESRLGGWARTVFLGAGVAVMLSTELALLDAVSRVAADLLRAGPLRESARWTASRLYFALVWGFISFGALVLLLGWNQPLALLVTSSALNAGVMFLYAGLLLVLNLRSFRGELRPGPLRVAALGGCVLFYGGFSALTLWREVAKLAGSAP